MEKITLTDIHNRRRNIEAVAKVAREMGMPFLAWPEDKELLRLSDLPVFDRVQANFAPAWRKRGFFVGRAYRVFTDEMLREKIKPGRLYHITNRYGEHVFEVQEWILGK